MESYRRKKLVTEKEKMVLPWIFWRCGEMNKRSRRWAQRWRWMESYLLRFELTVMMDSTTLGKISLAKVNWDTHMSKSAATTALNTAVIILFCWNPVEHKRKHDGIIGFFTFILTTNVDMGFFSARSIILIQACIWPKTNELLWQK